MVNVLWPWALHLSSAVGPPRAIRVDRGWSPAGHIQVRIGKGLKGIRTVFTASQRCASGVVWAVQTPLVFLSTAIKSGCRVIERVQLGIGSKLDRFDGFGTVFCLYIKIGTDIAMVRAVRIRVAGVRAACTRERGVLGGLLAPSASKDCPSGRNKQIQIIDKDSCLGKR